MSVSLPSEFTRELLDELSNDGFRVTAWRRFFSRSWQRSLEDIRESPALTRSFLRSATVTGVIGLAIVLLSWRYQHASVAIRSFVSWLPWYVLAVVFALTHLGMSDDGAGHRVERFHVPNRLSFVRLALAPLVLLPGLASLVDGPVGAVFATFVALLALTDVLDGWIARRAGQETRLGAMLDYLGDLAFLTFLGVGLYLAGAIPASLLGLMILRYPLGLIGAVVLYFIRGPAQLAPTTLGRVTTLALGIVLLLIACGVWLQPAWLSPALVEPAVLGIQLLLVASVVHLIYRGVSWGAKPVTPENNDQIRTKGE